MARSSLIAAQDASTDERPQRAEAVIRLEAVAKTYARGGAPVQALRGADLVVPRGQFAAIMGRSGSGKSTLLHILGLLDAEYEGTYRLNGRVVSGLTADELSPIRNREIGFVFQSFHLLPQLDILENAALPALYAGRPREECMRAAQARLEQLGLGQRLSHKPMELSIGQRQRAAIARALVNEPTMILADEPTGALDSRTADEILDVLRDLHRSGVTLVLVTHDPDVGAAAERIIHLHDGQIGDGTV